MARQKDYGTLPKVAPPSPPPLSKEDSATWLTRVFFLWFAPLVRLSAQRRLTTADFWPLPARNRTEVVAAHFRREYAQSKSLYRAMFRITDREIVMSGLIRVGGLACTAVSPVVFYLVIQKATLGDASPWKLVLLLFAFFATRLLSSVCTRHASRWAHHATNRACGAVEAVIFEAMLAETPSAPTKRTAAEWAKLCFQTFGDVSRAVRMVHGLWETPLTLAIKLYLLYRVVGTALLGSVVGAAALWGLVLVLVAGESRMLARGHEATADEVSAVNEAFKTIQSIKLAATERQFLRKIQAARDQAHMGDGQAGRAAAVALLLRAKHACPSHARAGAFADDHCC